MKTNFKDIFKNILALRSQNKILELYEFVKTSSIREQAIDKKTAYAKCKLQLLKVLFSSNDPSKSQTDLAKSFSLLKLNIIKHQKYFSKNQYEELLTKCLKHQAQLNPTKVVYNKSIHICNEYLMHSPDSSLFKELLTFLEISIAGLDLYSKLSNSATSDFYRSISSRMLEEEGYSSESDNPDTSTLLTNLEHIDNILLEVGIHDLISDKDVEDISEDNGAAAGYGSCASKAESGFNRSTESDCDDDCDDDGDDDYEPSASSHRASNKRPATVEQSQSIDEEDKESDLDSAPPIKRSKAAAKDNFEIDADIMEAVSIAGARPSKIAAMYRIFSIRKKSEKEADNTPQNSDLQSKKTSAQTSENQYESSDKSANHSPHDTLRSEEDELRMLGEAAATNDELSDI